jgi:hypothetical protein
LNGIWEQYQISQSVVPKYFDDTIGTQDQAVSSLQLEGSAVGFHELMTCSQGFGQHVLSRVETSLPLIDLPGAPQPADERMVLGYLG